MGNNCPATFSISHSPNNRLDPALHAAKSPYRVSSFQPHFSTLFSKNYKQMYLHLTYNIMLLNRVLDLIPYRRILSLFPHNLLNLDHKMLLRPQNWPRPCYSNPSNKVRSRKSIMLHRIAGNQAPRTSQPSLTMNSHSALLAFDQLQKLINNCRIRRCAISKNKIMMFNALFREPTGLIGLVIEPDNHLHSHLFEYRHIIRRREHSILFLRTKSYPILVNTRIIRRTERHKLPRHDPVQIAILYTLVMLVLSQVEFLIVEPRETNGVL